MKVYEENYKSEFSYPEDMKKILNHLNSNGNFLVSESIIEDLYHDFSDEIYGDDWTSVNERVLEEFEAWLWDDYED